MATFLHIVNLSLSAPRRQLGVLRRSVKRPKLTSADRLLWVWLSDLWTDWRSSLVIVRPETVIGWHRKAFRLFWTWKIRHGRPGRPAVLKDVRELIRKMRRENPLWGTPQSGLSRLIVRINWRISCDTGGRPGWPLRTFQVQTSRNALRCQATTVSGSTMTKADRQSLQASQSHAQSSRSAGVSFGRFTERCRTPIWWRNARISN